MLSVWLLIPPLGAQTGSVTRVIVAPVASPGTQYVSTEPWSLSTRKDGVIVGPIIPAIGGVGGIPSVMLYALSP